ncbi:N-terminal EF-hand calcium-binding protein 1 [Tachysurus ichikawai]
MLSCTEMITMCLQSAKREYLRSDHEQLQQHKHGLNTFHDMMFYTSVYNDDLHDQDFCVCCIDTNVDDT